MTSPQSIALMTARQRASTKRQIFKAMMGDPRALALHRRERNLLRQLLGYMNVATGHLRYATMNATLERELSISTTTLARARRGLIEQGLIIGYRPGDGRHPGRYTLARSWEEADAAAAERRRTGGKPYFPPIPDRSLAAQQLAAPQPPAAPPTQRQKSAPGRRPKAAAPERPWIGPASNETYKAEMDAAAHSPHAAPDNPDRLKAQERARAELDAVRAQRAKPKPPQDADPSPPSAA